MERILDNGKLITLTIGTGIIYGLNEVIQQVKHIYYDLKGIPNKRIERGEFDSDAFFDDFPMYLKSKI